VPEKKVTAATVAAAVTIVVVWLLRTFAHVDVPAEVALAISTVAIAAAGYLAPHTHRPDPAPAGPTPAAPAAPAAPKARPGGGGSGSPSAS